jgi:3'(2'), 5'-bisphosphate nucleotidase
MNNADLSLLSLPDLATKTGIIAREAASRILDIYESDFAIGHKDDKSPLTAADMASHKTICSKLAELTPGIPVLSEESANLPFTARRQWQKYWLVDPLDGTREFIKRNGEFTVNIALINHHEPVIGVVHVPVTGMTYFASKGNGAYKQSNNEPPQKICTRKTNPEHITVAGSRSHGSERQKRFFESLGDIEILAIGSSLKFCLVAEGLVDLYPRFGPTSEWDTAAAQCIVEEAGGIVTDEKLEPLRYNTKDSLLNPDFLVIADPAYDWMSIIQGREMK